MIELTKIRRLHYPSWPVALVFFIFFLPFSFSFSPLQCYLSLRMPLITQEHTTFCPRARTPQDEIQRQQGTNMNCTQIMSRQWWRRTHNTHASCSLGWQGLYPPHPTPSDPHPPSIWKVLGRDLLPRHEPKERQTALAGDNRTTWDRLIHSQQMCETWAGSTAVSNQRAVSQCDIRLSTTERTHVALIFKQVHDSGMGFKLQGHLAAKRAIWIYGTQVRTPGRLRKQGDAI